MERLDNLYPREAMDYGERQVSIHTGEGFLMWHFTQAPYFYTQFFYRYFPMKQGVLFEMGLIPRLWLESYDNSSPFVFKIVRLFLAQPCMSKFHFNQLYLEKRNQDHFIFSSRGVLLSAQWDLGRAGGWIVTFKPNSLMPFLKGSQTFFFVFFCTLRSIFSSY